MDGAQRSPARSTERSAVNQVALELATAARQLSRSIPRGHRSVADHLLRAAANTVLLLAEGADRSSAGEKRQRFVESRAECGEVAAAAELAVVLGLAPSQQAAEVQQLANRVAAMLTRLLQRLA